MVNFFLLSWDPDECVKAMFDKHIVKMPLETCQLLSTTWWLLEPDVAKKWNQKNRIYKKLSNHNHGVCKWVSETEENYRIMIRFGLKMCEEFQFRQGCRHSAHDKMEFLNRSRSPNGFVQQGLTDLYLAMPDKYKDKDPVVAYRKLYMSEEKNYMAAWKNRGPPNWWEWE
jgi:Pyrimidine dimer DNA glycosylase